jgi:hypothetical protein
LVIPISIIIVDDDDVDDNHDKEDDEEGWQGKRRGERKEEKGRPVIIFTQDIQRQQMTWKVSLAQTTDSERRLM